MSLWTRLGKLLRRSTPPASLTSPEEHAEAQRRLREIETRVQRVEIQRDLAMRRRPRHGPELRP